MQTNIFVELSVSVRYNRFQQIVPAGFSLKRLLNNVVPTEKRRGQRVEQVDGGRSRRSELNTTTMLRQVKAKRSYIHFVVWLHDLAR